MAIDNKNNSNEYYNDFEKQNMNNSQQSDENYYTEKRVAENVNSSNNDVDTIIERIISNSISYKATDVHIDEIKGLSRVRYRINGKLINDDFAYTINHSTLVQKIKLMAELFVRDEALIQKGEVCHNMDNGQNVKFTVFTMPSYDSDLIVLKFSHKRPSLKLNNIGMSSEDLRLISKIFEKKSGVVIFTGLSGSGRSTTLDVVLDKLVLGQNSIVKIENNKSQKKEGVCQIELNELNQMTLSEALKKVNDFDFDIIIIDSEIDNNSLKTLFNIALSGKLIMFTSYFPTVFDTITGIISMGIEPYTLAAAMEGIIAQQLIRVVCPECNKNKMMGKPVSQNCSSCEGEFYISKTCVFEVFKMGRDYWNLILKRNDQDNLKKTLEKEKCSFENNCKRLIKAGITTIEEVISIGMNKDNHE